jgi:hypothetical protein
VSIAIKELTMEEVDQVAGATVAQCVAVVSATGGWFGAYMVGLETAGFGSWAGFQIGSTAGAAIGGIACNYFA